MGTKWMYPGHMGYDHPGSGLYLVDSQGQPGASYSLIPREEKWRSGVKNLTALLSSFVFNLEYTPAFMVEYSLLKSSIVKEPICILLPHVLNKPEKDAH